ncbi:oxidoreductase [Primorskyibacter flagellatus]|uniref:2-oxoglutarate-dependent ethylene/succinate-forming enzyme n=1 Tax=Primorskyibacter flagellatus TaxID=1387277 RepID=A0A917A3B9_9RHOB|nr:isopenicillin N synthase family oxygenase [Primorskyibacter flagellatus]GGE24707.1 oxidoreductase [Primorskyibacter flagellatus]
MIPVLSYAQLTSDPKAFSEALGTACRETGFFLLADHPVPEDLVAGVFAHADTFFSLPSDLKQPLSISNNPHNRGWAQMGTESLDDTSVQTDRKEAFNVGYDLSPEDPRVLAGEPFRGVNVWPDLPGFRDTLLAYYRSVHGLGVRLHDAIAMDLRLPADYFVQHFTEPMATLRILSYPEATGADGEIGAGAHTDYGSLTLLMTDGEPGLQVRPRGGDWTDVPHVPGAFVVNIGDCLMRWSNDTYVSTPHRVLPPRRKRRSIAFFLDPNPESVIAALPGTGEPKYPEITGADYLRSRLDATYKPDPL